MQNRTRIRKRDEAMRLVRKLSLLVAEVYFFGFQSRAICCALASWSGFSLLAM